MNKNTRELVYYPAGENIERTNSHEAFDMHRGIQ